MVPRPPNATAGPPLRPFLRGGALLGLVLLCLSAALADTPNEDLEKNRQLLEKWRSDPAHINRLRQDLRAFLALPPEKQQRLRRLDRELHAEESIVQVRLWRVLERYAAWLDRLPAEDRQRVENASTAAERLQVVRDIRLKQWQDRLPLAVQEQIRNTPEDQRPALLAKLQEQDRRRRRDWEIAMQHWEDLQRPVGPARLSEFSVEVRRYVKEVLEPVLTEDEKNRLKQVDGLWPFFPRTLVDYAERRPMLSPGYPTPRRFEELPEEWRQALGKLKKFPPPNVQRQEGKWPDYAIAVTKLARARNKNLRPLGPVRVADLPPPARQFVNRNLLPKLSPEQDAVLKEKQGLWPEFPQELLRLARQHGLVIPGMMLPLSRDLWERYRPRVRAGDDAPAVPDNVLLEFAKSLSSDDKKRLGISVLDPSSKERLQEEWIRRNQNEWQQLRARDQQKRNRSFVSP
jgi:hypothetical protein